MCGKYLTPTIHFQLLLCRVPISKGILVFFIGQTLTTDCIGQLESFILQRNDQLIMLNVSLQD